MFILQIFFLSYFVTAANNTQNRYEEEMMFEFDKDDDDFKCNTEQQCEYPENKSGLFERNKPHNYKCVERTDPANPMKKLLFYVSENPNYNSNGDYAKTTLLDTKSRSSRSKKRSSNS